MARFTGSINNDSADAVAGTLTGFTGGSIAKLQDTIGDTFLAGGGRDTVIAGVGNDAIRGGGDQDSIDGGDGSDRIFGDYGNDILNGGDGLVDELFGGRGADLIHGGVGSDIIEGGAGVDNVFGDEGADVIRLLDGDIIDNIDGGGTPTTEVDSLELSFITSYAAVIDLAAETWNFTIALGGPASIVNIEIINGTQQGDTISGTAGQETFVGHDGNDVLNGRGDIDSLHGFKGNDTLSGEDGDDQLTGGSGADSLSGGNDNDRLDGDTGNDVLRGDAGNDSLFGSDNNDELNGGQGGDQLSGDSGRDTLNGGAHNDSLDGGSGNDVLFGGLGADRYLFTETLNEITNVDRIKRFVSGEDVIGLSASIFAAIGASVDAGELVIGTAPADANDYLIYDASTGTLSYDEDGAGAIAQVDFAVLFNKPASLTIGDFVIV